eukprot:TRINITY_DN3955_c0_g1_i2.p2 TRINITY_DN3955_c0_g1~~TRINITY_DN3955_c0_g1_i2.p2  ORF type:complete len:103 (-),score=13.87 TRINITY_DN3955_c0_g1_i2:47-355(-)
MNSSWFIGVSAPRDYNGSVVNYGIWFGSSCPPSCQPEQGVCGEGEETGICRCRYGKEGLDCSEDAPMGREYLVLITLASILVVSFALSVSVPLKLNPKSFYD